jgi:hypothetical protein
MMCAASGGDTDRQIKCHAVAEDQKKTRGDDVAV